MKTQLSILRFALGLSLLWPSLGLAQSASDSVLGMLLTLPGDLVDVRYTPGALDRAVHVQDRAELLVEDFRSWSDADTTLVIYLLSREEWRRSEYKSPYGLAIRVGGHGLAINSDGDSGTVAMWKDLLGSALPTLPGAPLRGTPEEAASLGVCDILSVHEASRVMLETADFAGDQTWIEPLMVHTVALSWIQRHEQARLPEVRQVFGSLSAQGGGPGAHSLDEIPTRSLRTYLWFQAQFHAGATALVEPEGGGAAKKLFKLARKNGGVLKATDLVQEFPGLDSWIMESFAAE